MRLKEIKPNTAIHCTSKEQIRCLIDVGIVSENYAEFDVPIWICFYGDGISSWMPEVDSKGIKGKNYYEEKGIRVVGFSDLIIPEMSAEEVLQICSEICDAGPCEKYPMGKGNCFSDSYTDKKKVLEICQQWKADHDKKEPEIETVDICRIIEIQPDGHKRCVHEEGLNLDGEVLFKEQIENILKRYCMEHDGEFIAVRESVSRVKAVE